MTPKNLGKKNNITQDDGAHTAIHIFEGLIFFIARGVAAQILSNKSYEFLIK